MRLLVVLFGLLVPAAAMAEGKTQPCDIHADLSQLGHSLAHVAKRLVANEPITIVAIGSSSTSGSGATSPAANYPSRLKVELDQLLPGRDITVINRGVGGEEIKDMLKRFDRDVLVYKPDLVLWQLGTNAVIRDHPLIDEGASIRDGINELKIAGSDVVLIDPQFAPKVIAKPHAQSSVELISLTAKREDVGLFRRYELMRRWHAVNGMPFADFVSPDGLHMNDWSYACLAKSLAVAIAEVMKMPPHGATASRVIPR